MFNIYMLYNSKEIKSIFLKNKFKLKKIFSISYIKFKFKFKKIFLIYCILNLNSILKKLFFIYIFYHYLNILILIILAFWKKVYFFMNYF